MKKPILLTVAFACLMAAQEPSRNHTINPNPAATVEKEAAAEHSDPMLKWKWINFAVLAGVLGYLIGKNAPGFFKGRSAAIQRDIREATKLREQAENRVRQMEQRLAALGQEIEKLRREAKEAMAHEGERIRQETANQIARVQQAAEQEIASHAKHVTQELKAYSAKLAIDLAEQRIQLQMNGDTQNTLVGRFLHDLNGKGARN
jgi:F-type H+-transporting ATPase subunit b